MLLRQDKRIAMSALNSRNWNEAYSSAAQLLEADDCDAELHFIAGVAAIEQHRFLVAQKHFRRAVELHPDRADFQLYFARACAASHHYDLALDAAAKAERLLHAGDAAGFDMLGVVLVQCQAYERAVRAFDRATQIAPNDAGMHFNLGTALTFRGDLGGAERELEIAIRINPHHWRAHHSLSQLRKQTPDSNHIARLSALAERATGRVTATTFLNMALAKEHEDLGDYVRAFEHCVRGKGAPKELLGYSREREREIFDALSAGFADICPREDRAGSQAEGPIFIVGMPRSGTTLVDRIVSSHPLVYSAGELHDFPSAWKRTMGGPSFDVFNPTHIRTANSGNVNWREMGDGYLSSVSPLIGAHRFFTDKLPQNFLYLGYIACALPNAKIICVRRHPLDTCLSNFRQLFAPESPYFDYSYDLIDIGHYYLLFDRIMRHWNAVFPGRILEVQYEELVDDQEMLSRAIVAHCGLEWDEACLSFERNALPVATASAAQVRRPLYRSALGRWKRYEKELQPLRELLLANGIVFPE